MIEDGELYKLGEAFKEALQNNEQEYLAQIAQQWQALEARLTTKYEALAARVTEIRNAGVSPVPKSLLLELEQTKLAVAETVLEADRMALAWKNQIEARQLEMFAVANGDALSMLQLAAIEAGVDIGAVSIGGRLPREAIQKLLDATVNGTPLRALLEGKFGEHMEEALSILVDGVASGTNPREVARLMTKALGPWADNAITIARTESLRAYRMATTEAYRASGIVGKYKRLATRDARTCLGCLFDDGAIYDIDEELPEHPNGRCTTVPVLDGEDPEWLRGKDWFRTLDSGQQREMLGPTRYKRWKDGDLELEDIVGKRDGGDFGPSIGPAPVNA